jgi:small subunit ribosomal protein S1
MEQVQSLDQDHGESYWRSVLGENSEPVAPSDSQATEPAAASPVETTSGWALGEESYLQGDILELHVVGYNRGGLLVDLGDVRGFVPASQLITLPRQVSDEARMQELANYVGKTLRLKAIECNHATNRLVFSERVANPPVSRVDQALNAIHQGQVYTGIIRNVTDFGAFVDLGGVEGLVHISELSWKHVKHPRDIIQPGQQVQVMVIDIDRNQKRIACSLKRLVPNPWALIAEKVKPGDWIEGEVTNMVSFGAFVRLAEGVEGLIHVSELASGNFLDPHSVVKEGQIVRVRVMSVDATRKRVSLSLRAETTPDKSFTEMPPPPDAGYWQSIADSE